MLSLFKLMFCVSSPERKKVKVESTTVWLVRRTTASLCHLIICIQWAIASFSDQKSVTAIFLDIQHCTITGS